jgi:anti-anti-sigma regulatory factor
MEIERQTIAETRLARAGELTLGCARQLRADLLKGLEFSEPVVLDLQAVTEVDLACLQVLAAARLSFSTRERPLHILWGQAVEQAWDQAGYPPVE